MAKRIFDFISAGLLIIVLLIPCLVISLLIFINLGTPIFFKQKRPGLKGKIFIMYKFRTMKNEKGSNYQVLSDNERLTKLGRSLRNSSLDELPELLNVLKGEMSLVGPRPLLIEYLPLYNETQKRRHDVKPGITGWAQVNGRNAITWEGKFKYDIFYVDNKSFLLDMKIILLTIKKTLCAADVNQSESITMNKFDGN